jgi:hypothetical protein
VQVVDDPAASSTWRACDTLWLDLPVTLAGTPIANAPAGMSAVTAEPTRRRLGRSGTRRESPPRATCERSRHDRREAFSNPSDGCPILCVTISDRMVRRTSRP